jgi:hypothetical protein
VEDRAGADLAVLIRMCDLGANTLSQGIARAAVLLAADVGRPVLQLPQYRPGGSAGAVSSRLDGINEALRVSDEEQQQLQGAGQQLAKHCSSLGLDLTAVQQTTWALAEAAAAAAPLVLLMKGCIAASLSTEFAANPSRSSLLQLLLDFGMTTEHVMAVYSSVTARQGACSVSEATAAALLHSPAAEAYMQQLTACGVALSILPTAAACNNHRCTSFSGASEQQGVSGKACRCSGCRLAYYCQHSCQRQHWAAHKPAQGCAGGPCNSNRKQRLASRCLLRGW